MTADLVVGGGIAGLVVARRLALAGRRVRLLEATERLGGQVAPQTVAGVQLDAAAESFATRGGTVATLLDELGLADDVTLPAPTPAWLYSREGRATPLPATGLLGIPGDPGAADVRQTIGTLAALRARLDQLLPARVGREATSLGELVRRRMGRAVVDELVAPVVRGVHSRNPDEVAIAVASPQLLSELASRGSLAAAVTAIRAAAPAGSQVAGLRGGMSRLATTLAAECERLGVVIELGTAVDSVDRDGVTVGGHRISGRTILAAPDPRHPANRRDITLVTLVTDAPAWDAHPRGTGLLVAEGARDVRARALTHLSAKWSWVREALPGRHGVRLSYDGAHAVDPRTALADAETLLGVPAAALIDHRVQQLSRPNGPAPAAPPDGVAATGEQRAGTGLAAVIHHAEHTAASALRELAATPQTGEDGPQ